MSLGLFFTAEFADDKVVANPVIFATESVAYFAVSARALQNCSKLSLSRCFRFKSLCGLIALLSFFFIKAKFSNPKAQGRKPERFFTLVIF